LGKAIQTVVHLIKHIQVSMVFP